MTEPSLKEFCNLYSLKNLIKKPTCFKDPGKPKVVDLLLTNKTRSFCNCDTHVARLSSFHNLTLTLLKTYFKKQAPKMINYQNCKNFSNEPFCADLVKELYNNSIGRMTLLFSLMHVKSY